MRISTMQMHATMNSSMQQTTGKVNQSLLQMLSGKEILKPSDDPLAALQIMGMNDELAQLEQYQKNIAAAELSLSAEETVLNDVNDTLQRLRDLTLSAGNDGMTPEDRAAIAQEVDQLTEQLVDMANTRSASGEYLFGGTRGDTAPVAKDDDGNWVYLGGDSSREIPITDNRTIAQGDTAEDIFFSIGSADGSDIFTSLEKLSDALKTGDPAELDNVLATSLDTIDDAMQSVGSTLTSVGTRMNTLEMVQKANEESVTMTTDMKGSLENLDYAEAITQLTMEFTALQATQQSYGKVSTLSLFNYI